MLSASKTPSSDIHSVTISFLMSSFLSCFLLEMNEVQNQNLTTRRTIEIDNDFADGPSRCEVFIGGAGLVETEARVDHGMQRVQFHEADELLEAASAAPRNGAQGHGAAENSEEVERH